MRRAAVLLIAAWAALSLGGYYMGRRYS